MTDQEMIRAAETAGFKTPVIVNTADIPFKAEFRRYCEENACGKYNINYSCPPDCGSTDEMAERVRAHRRALILRSVWELDYNDKAAVKAAKGTHNKQTIALRKFFRAKDVPGLMCGSGCCSLCTPCAKESGEECRFPEDRWSCMSAYCANVQELAALCGMEYWLGEGKVAFFGMYCFD